MANNFLKQLFRKSEVDKYDLNKPVLNEPTYTHKVGSAIDRYLNTEDVFIPHSTQQAPKNFRYDSHPFDLIKKIANDRFLLLEIKITRDFKSFPSYKPEQHEFYKKIRDAGIPVDYCYNMKNEYPSGDYEYVLVNSNTSTPKWVCDADGNLIAPERHRSLKTHLDSLISPEGIESNGSKVLGALFSEKVIESVAQANLKFLFIAYNSSLNRFIKLDEKDIKRIYLVISKYIDYKQMKFNFKDASISEIRGYFEKNEVLIEEAIAEFKVYRKSELAKEKAQRQNISRSKSRDKGRNISDDFDLSM